MPKIVNGLVVEDGSAPQTQGVAVASSVSSALRPLFNPPSHVRIFGTSYTFSRVLLVCLIVMLIFGIPYVIFIAVVNYVYHRYLESTGSALPTDLRPPHRLPSSSTTLIAGDGTIISKGKGNRKDDANQRGAPRGGGLGRVKTVKDLPKPPRSS